MPRRRPDYRGFVLYLVLLSFIFMVVSGTVIYIAPSGRCSRDILWTLFGLDRAAWQSLHLVFAFVFIASGLIHLAYNWRGFLHHLRDRVRRRITLKWEAAIALLIAVWLAIGAVMTWPPARELHGLNEYFRKFFWIERHAGVVAPTRPRTAAPLPKDGTANDRRLPDKHPAIEASERCSDCHKQSSD